MTSIDVDVHGLEALFDELDDLEDAWADDQRWVVGTAVEYSIYLEFGTSKMDPKPFFRPALQEARRDIEGFIRDNTNTVVSEIGSADELVRTIAFALERRVKEIVTRKGLIETGTLRASVQAVPGADVGQLPSADEIDPAASAEVEVSA